MIRKSSQFHEVPLSPAFAPTTRWCVLFAAVLFFVSSRTAQGGFCSPPYTYYTSCGQQNDPPPCVTCRCPPGGGAGGGGAGGGGGGCPSCFGQTLSDFALPGMPYAWVSEPLLQLRLEDQPLGSYNPGLGPAPIYQLSYRNKGALPEEDIYFSFGTNWSCSLREYVFDLADG